MLLQVLTPLHQAVSANLGSRTAAWLYDRLTRRVRRARRAWATSRTPSSTNDLTMARDFDLGITGPPLSIAMDFIASGLVEMVGGLASAVVLVRLRVVGAAPARAARGSHALAAARERGLARPQHRRGARRAARMPTTPTGSRSTRPRRRSCGSSGSPAGRRPVRRAGARRLYELQCEATRLRERSVLWCLVDRARRQPRRVLGARRRGRRRRASTLGRGRRRSCRPRSAPARSRSAA